MSQVINTRRSTLLVLAVSAVALWLILPIVLQVSSSRSHAQTTNTAPDLVAVLSGTPTGNAVPTGVAVYNETTIGDVTGRVLHVEVSNVFTGPTAVPRLAVFHNTTLIGSILLDANHHGVLHLSTANGGSVPTPVVGDTITVKNGTATVLSGTFRVPATPSPTPTVTPPSLRLWAPLMAPAANTVMNPRGLAQYAEWGTTARALDAYVSYVPLPEGAVLNVGVGGSPVGTITLHNHAGLLRLRTDNGGTVPVITPGTPISVRHNGIVILAGAFTNNPPPPPTVPARAFAAKLLGRHEVPPVQTLGHGLGYVVLNPARTAINVQVRFMGLSSAPTAVTINGPAAFDENGPVIFTLAAPTPTTTNTAGQTFTVTPEQVEQLRNGLWYFQVATVDHPTGEIRGQLRPINRRDDFDGDGLSDIGVIRTRTGLAPENAANDWYTLNSDGYTMTAQSIGSPGDVNVQGDYDGDGVADIAMFTPSTGVWQIRRSGTMETTYAQFGMTGDIPVVGDYDGDTMNDLAVYRPSVGNWYILRSSDGGFSAAHWGTAGDRPVSGDFDGDTRNDLAVFRPSEGNWYIFRSSDGGLTAMHWGVTEDNPVAGDFDGDGRSDIAVFRPSEGNWYINRSSDSAFAAYHFGTTGDIPVACEFDGDSASDIAVYRPSDGNWYIYRSTDNGMGVFHFGIATDLPVPKAYTPQ